MYVPIILIPTSVSSLNVIVFFSLSLKLDLSLTDAFACPGIEGFH